MKALILWIAFALCGVDFATDFGSDIQQKQSVSNETRMDLVDQISRSL